MIHLEKIKWVKCQPPSFKKTCPCTIFSPSFLVFQTSPSSGGIWNLLLPIKRGGPELWIPNCHKIIPTDLYYVNISLSVLLLSRSFFSVWCRVGIMYYELIQKSTKSCQKTFTLFGCRPLENFWKIDSLRCSKIEFPDCIKRRKKQNEYQLSYKGCDDIIKFWYIVY